MKAWKVIMSVLWEVVKMRKLLSANFSRLWKAKVFWLCMGCMLVYSLVYMWNGCRQAAAMPEYHRSLDDYYFQFALCIGAFCALFCSMFLGTEYSDGTIRNKIIVGHTRTEIYLANFILAFAAGVIIMSVWLVGALVAIPVLGTWEMGVSGLFLYLLIAIMFVGAFVSVFTCIAMLSDNKAITIAISIFLFLGLLIYASMLYNGLSQPQMTDNIEMTADGIKMGEPMPNPDYVGGTKRVVYQFVLDVLPTGQALQVWQLGIGSPFRPLASSVCIMVVMTLVGILIFQRKNIR